MSLTNLRLSDFKRIAKLLTRKESLLAMIAAIDQELQKFEGQVAGSSATNGIRHGSPRRGRPPGTGSARQTGPGRKGRRGRRGAVKEAIIAVLKGAGKSGAHVKDIVAKTGAKAANVRVWFYSTGQKIKNIKQIAPATYRWED